MSNRSFIVPDGTLTHVLISPPVPPEIKERFSGFFWSVYETDVISIITMLNVSDNDQEIINQMLADLAEVGYTDFPEREQL